MKLFGFCIFEKIHTKDDNSTSGSVPDLYVELHDKISSNDDEILSGFDSVVKSSESDVLRARDSYANTVNMYLITKTVYTTLIYTFLVQYLPGKIPQLYVIYNIIYFIFFLLLFIIFRVSMYTIKTSSIRKHIKRMVLSSEVDEKDHALLKLALLETRVDTIDNNINYVEDVRKKLNCFVAIEIFFLFIFGLLFILNKLEVISCM